MHIVTLKLNRLLVPLCMLTMVSFANADELIEVSTDSGVFRGHASGICGRGYGLQGHCLRQSTGAGSALETAGASDPVRRG